MARNVFALCFFLFLFSSAFAVYPGETITVRSFTDCEFLNIKTDYNFFSFIGCSKSDSSGLNWRCYCQNKKFDLIVRINDDAGAGSFSIGSSSFEVEKITYGTIAGKAAKLLEPNYFFFDGNAFKDVNSMAESHIEGDKEPVDRSKGLLATISRLDSIISSLVNELNKEKEKNTILDKSLQSAVPSAVSKQGSYYDDLLAKATRENRELRDFYNPILTFLGVIFGTFVVILTCEILLVYWGKKRKGVR